MFVASIMIVTVYYLTGIGFGFYKVATPMLYWWKYIIPYAVTIVFAEYIRRVLLAQNARFISTISYVAFVLLDISLFMEQQIFRSFYDFMNHCGMVVFPAITGNILYHYVSKKYGYLPNIAYRVFISVYPYFIPVKPKMPEAMLAFIR